MQSSGAQTQVDESTFLFPTANQSRFRFNAIKVFLTYPHSSFDLQRLHQELHSRYPIAKYIYCLEEHENGEPHVHAALWFVRKINTTDQRCFDFEDRHPNIGRVRCWSAAVRYCRKDGNIFTNLSEDQRSSRTEANDVYSQALAAPTREDAYTIIQEGAARDWVLYNGAIRNSIENHFAPAIPPYDSAFSPSDFRNVPEDAFQWAFHYISRPRRTISRPKSLLLVGKSRIGKTAWARSLGPHIYINGYYSLDEMMREGDYIVCDDIPWEKFPSWKSILGCQEEFTLTDKYRKKFIFRNWNKPCIVCWNREMYPKEFEDRNIAQWIDENCIKVFTDNPFY